MIIEDLQNLVADQVAVDIPPETITVQEIATITILALLTAGIVIGTAFLLECKPKIKIYRIHPLNLLFNLKSPLGWYTFGNKFRRGNSNKGFGIRLIFFGLIFIER